MKASTAQHIKNTEERQWEAGKVQHRVMNAVHYYGHVLGQRPGQALMNALDSVAPDLYEALSGSEFDCFDIDSRISSTLNELGYMEKLFWRMIGHA